MMMPNSYGTIQKYTPNREISGVTIPRISSYAYTGNTLQLSWHPGSKISGITVPPSRCWYLIHTVQFSNTGSWEVDTPNPTIPWNRKFSGMTILRIPASLGWWSNMSCRFKVRNHITGLYKSYAKMLQDLPYKIRVQKKLQDKCYGSIVLYIYD